MRKKKHGNPEKCTDADPCGVCDVCKEEEHEARSLDAEMRDSSWNSEYPDEDGLG